jgi:hypothetical protein
MDTLGKVYIILNFVNYNYASTIEWRKCKHVFPLKITILGFECEAIFMGANVTIFSFESKMVTLNDVVWLFTSRK